MEGFALLPRQNADVAPQESRWRSDGLKRVKHSYLDGKPPIVGYFKALLC